MHAAFHHLLSAQQTLMQMPQRQVEGVALHTDLLVGLLAEQLLQDQIAVVHKYVMHQV
jgi:hypothetical protein